ncbi:MAG: hypothetical protein ACRCUQ_04660 [Alphaproteobacteria bacterium]
MNINKKLSLLSILTAVASSSALAMPENNIDADQSTTKTITKSAPAPKITLTEAQKKALAGRASRQQAIAAVNKAKKATVQVTSKPAEEEKAPALVVVPPAAPAVVDPAAPVVADPVVAAPVVADPVVAAPVVADPVVAAPAPVQQDQNAALVQGQPGVNAPAKQDQNAALVQGQPGVNAPAKQDQNAAPAPVQQNQNADEEGEEGEGEGK